MQVKIPKEISNKEKLSMDLLKKFSDIIKPSIEKINHNLYQISALKMAFDNLLPKLNNST